MNDESIPGEAPSQRSRITTRFVARHVGTSRARPGGDAGGTRVTPPAHALIDAIVPEVIRLREPLSAARSRWARPRRWRGCAAIATRNRVLKSFIGQGYYGTHTPGVILRNVLENPAWYTAYTPYQAEISQGRLEALVNFQTMVCDLTAMEIANASMLDEATAAAEAMTLLRRVSGSESTRFFVADDVLPQTLDVVRTRAQPLGIDVVTGPADDAPDAQAFGVLLQYPGGRRAPARLPRADRGRARQGRAGGRRHRPARADADRPARRMGRRRRRRLVAALRRADGLRRPACRIHGDARRIQALAARAAGRRVRRRRRAARPTASRCRRASSTSAARRRRRTSARRRCCSRSWRAMYAVYHGAEGLVRIARACTA